MKRIWIYSLALALSTVSMAQVSLEETYQESFFIEDEASVDITNKYGDVIVNTWFKDSVKMKVLLRADGKTRSVVAKELSRVDIDIRQIGNLISGTTKLDQGKSRGLLGDLLDQVNDYSQSMIGGKKIKIDYEIWLPEEVDISIENKFGDVYLSTLSGNVSIDLSHGDLRGNKITSDLVMDHSFGKHRFDHVEQGNFTLRGIESKIKTGTKLNIESSSSEMDFGDIEFVQINSRNDKIDIDQVRNMVGEGSFTDLELEMALSDISVDFDYGEIFINRIAKDFGKIILNGKSCDINMILDQGSYINTSITGMEAQMLLPNSMEIMKRDQLGEGKISLNGFVGNTNTTHGVLKVNADDGELIISIKETDIFTDKN